MAGIFRINETKIRPGSYYRITTSDTRAVAAQQGTVAVLCKSNFGPLSTPIELSKVSEIENTFGNGGTVDAITQAFEGGAVKVIGCRVGKSGTEASIGLKDTGDTTTIATIKAKYVGNRDYSVTIKDSLTDETARECIFYSGTKELEKYTFTKGGDEASSLKEAMSGSGMFSITASGDGEKTFKVVTQETFTAGTDPTVNTEDYSTALTALEAYDFDIVVADSDETAVHLLLSEFVNRIFETGQMAMTVVAEKESTTITDRMSHAAAFNNEKVVYLLNSAVTADGIDIAGYQTAARIAGMIAGTVSSRSLTHMVLNGVTEIRERLTNAQIETAETKGCLVLSYSPAKTVWIDSAINTLITPADNQDNGWKKIRRTKTRMELIRRVNEVVENLIGIVDNDTNGRATVMSQIQTVGNDMIDEGKLVSFSVEENEEVAADADSSYFNIDVVDKDSLEHVYLVFSFRFSTEG